MTSIFDLFSGHGVPAKTKLVCLGSMGENLSPWVRSLNLEHVSPAGSSRSEISRSPAKQADPTLASLRRWFFARKPDAGFVLSDFPATLLQAIVFDEWLDARGETLTAVLVGENADSQLINHYRTLGLLIERPELSAA